MGIFDKLTKLAEKAATAVVQTSDKINQTYQKEGFDGIVNKTADSFNKASQKTQNYFTTIGEKNKQIIDSIADKDLEGTLAKATAVVINTTQTIVKDAAKVTMDTVDSVSKNIEKLVAEQKIETISPEVKVVKIPVSDVKELFLNEGQIAELDCMPIKLYVKHLGAETNVDGEANKYKLDTFTFMNNEQKWYDFNNQKGGNGSLSFINHYIRVKNGLLDNENTDVSKEIRNSSFDILSKIFKLKEYKEDLSSWIKEENAKPQTEKENTVKTKRLKKPAVKLVITEEVETPKAVIKKTVKKVMKKPAVEVVEAVVKPVVKKPSKKIVKEAVDEVFSTPVVKTSRKPKA